MKKLQITTQFLSTALIPSMFAHTAFAEVPALLPVQGYLTNADETVVDGPAAIGITLYSTSTATQGLFTETHNAMVDRGNFAVYVGEVQTLDLTMFQREQSIWLGISVNGDAELQPRIQLAAAPYAAFAQYAGDAMSLQGAAATDFAVSGHDHTWSEIIDVPPDLADGDDVLTQSAVEGYAQGVCYDTAAELAAAVPTWDQSAADDLTTATAFAGDVTGTYDTLDIAPNSIGSVEVAANSLTAADLAPNSVGSSEVATNSLTASDLAPNSVGASEIAAGQVGRSELSAAVVPITQFVTSAGVTVTDLNWANLANTTITAPATGRVNIWASSTVETPLGGANLSSLPGYQVCLGPVVGTAYPGGGNCYGTAVFRRYGDNADGSNPVDQMSFMHSTIQVGGTTRTYYLIARGGGTGDSNTFGRTKLLVQWHPL